MWYGFSRRPRSSRHHAGRARASTCLWASVALLTAGCDSGSSPPTPTADQGAPADQRSAGEDVLRPDGPGGGDLHRLDQLPGADLRLSELGVADSGSDLAVPDLYPPRDWGECTPIQPAPDEDPWSVRLPSAGFGGITTQASGGHTDVFLASPTDYIRVGTRLDWGGTVVFFGLTNDAQSNVIDANDPGRELQLALYDPTRARQGCAHDASCQSGTMICDASITYLGWNPVQGGDECGHGAQVLSHGQAGDALQLVVRPNQWNPDWDAPDCRKSSCGATGRPVDVTYTFELRFVREHVVEVMSQVTSQETIDHPSTGQEFPTLYVSNGQSGPDLPHLLDAAGNLVTLSTPANDGFFVGHFTSPGPWVTWQDAQHTYGVALAMDQGIRAWQGWRGAPPTAPYFHNVRAQIQFGLDAGGMVRGLSYLALGSYATVKGELEAALAERPPFGHLDAPPEPGIDYTPGSPVQVRGWALDTAAVSEVRLEVDGVPRSTIAVNGDRPDVCAVYPGYADCPSVGFSGQLSTAGLDGCPHLLRVIAADADGNSTVLGERLLNPL